MVDTVNKELDQNYYWSLKPPAHVTSLTDVKAGLLTMFRQKGMCVTFSTHGDDTVVFVPKMCGKEIKQT